jgi:hypothetical protein
MVDGVDADVVGGDSLVDRAQVLLVGSAGRRQLHELLGHRAHALIQGRQPGVELGVGVVEARDPFLEPRVLCQRGRQFGPGRFGRFGLSGGGSSSSFLLLVEHGVVLVQVGCPNGT